MGWFLFIIAVAGLSFFLGHRTGTKSATKEQTQARAASWDQGYKAAIEFLQGKERQRPHQATGTNVLAQGPPPPPVQPAPATVLPAEPASAAAFAGASEGLEVPAVEKQDKISLNQTVNTQAAQTPAPTPAPVFGSFPRSSTTPAHQAPYARATNLTPQPTTPAIHQARVLTPRERELRNINVTLYVAALLIVAAGAIFLSFALPPLAKLVSLFVVSAAFYGVGLYVHAVKKSLKPAASAFAGTGLALLPFCAVATHNTLGSNPQLIWLVFSVIGTLAVGFATVRLRSRVLAWVAVLILISTAMAGAATLQRGLFDYLIVLLVLSLLLSVIATRSTAVRNSLFYQALFATQQALPLLVLALALVMISLLTAGQFAWIFALLTVHLLLSLILIKDYRLVRFSAARATFMAMVLSFAVYLELNFTWCMAILAVLLALQGTAVVWFAKNYRELFAVTSSWWRAERTLLWVLVLVFAQLSVIPSYGLRNESWPTTILLPLLVSIALPVLLTRGKIESLALFLLALLPLGQLWNNSWRVLPVLVLVIAGLSLAHRVETTRSWRLVLSNLRWVLFLVFGATLARVIQVLATDGVFDWVPRADIELASTVGVWIALAALWIYNTVQRQKSVASITGTTGTTASTDETKLNQLALIIRMGASSLLTVFILMFLHHNVADRMVMDSFLGLQGESWFVAILLISVALVLTNAVITERSSQSQDNLALRLIVLVTNSGLFVVSFTERYWVLALIVGLAQILFYLFSARRLEQSNWKIIYAAAAQLTFSVSMWWLVHQLNFDVHGQLAVLALSTVAPQIGRLLVRYRSARPLSIELLLIAAGLLLLLPIVGLGYAVIYEPADRGVLLLLGILWGSLGLAAYLPASKEAKESQAFLLAPVLALSALVVIPALELSTTTGWFRTAWWTQTVSQILLLVLTLAHMFAEWRLRANKNLRYVLAVGMGFGLLVILLWNPSNLWQLVTTLALTVVFGLVVHTRGAGLYALGASAFLWISAMRAVQVLQEGRTAGGSPWLDRSWTLLVIAGILYVGAALHGRFAEPTPRYPRLEREQAGAAGHASRVYFGVMILALGVAGANLFYADSRTGVIIGGAVLILAAGLLVRLFELPTSLWRSGTNALILLGAALALLIYVRVVELPDFSLIGAYWTVVVSLIAARHFWQREKDLAHLFVLAAAGLATLTQLVSLVDANGTAQLFGLVFFVALISLGLKEGRRLLIWWGAIAVTAAVLWFLRDLAFLWLVLLGLALIVVAILRLVRVERKPRSEPADQGTTPTGANKESE